LGFTAALTIFNKIIMRTAFEYIATVKVLPCIAAFLLFSCLCVDAQIRKDHRIGLRLGAGYYEAQDDLVSPLIYAGGKFPLQLLYKYEGEKDRHNVNISYNGGELSNSINNITDEWAAGFDYSYHRYVLSFWEESGKMFVGGYLNNYFSNRTYYFKSYELRGKYYTDTRVLELVSSLGVSFLAEYEVNGKDKLAISIAAPIIAVVHRPDYSLQDGDIFNDKETDSDGNVFFSSEGVSTIDEYFHIGFTASCEVNASDYFNFRFAYGFKYYSITKPLKTKSIVNEIGVDILLLL